MGNNNQPTNMYNKPKFLQRTNDLLASLSNEPDLIVEEYIDTPLINDDIKPPSLLDRIDNSNLCRKEFINIVKTEEAKECYDILINKLLPEYSDKMTEEQIKIFKGFGETFFNATNGFTTNPTITNAMTQYLNLPTISILSNIFSQASAMAHAYSDASIILTTVDDLGSVSTGRYLLDFYPTNVTPTCSGSIIVYGNTASTTSFMNTIRVQSNLPFSNGLPAFANIVTACKAHSMQSFDTVCEANLVEVKNAVENAAKEIGTRFDFKGTSAGIDLKEQEITLFGDAEFQLAQVEDILRNKLTKRSVDVRFLDVGVVQKIGGDKVKQVVKVRNGIASEDAKKIQRLIKDSKLKLQAAIQGESVRVTGAKRDDLQSAMALIRKDLDDLPLSFNNFRD